MSSATTAFVQKPSPFSSPGQGRQAVLAKDLRIGDGMILRLPDGSMVPATVTFVALDFQTETVLYKTVRGVVLGQGELALRNRIEIVERAVAASED